jgi:hypothetical protein
MQASAIIAATERRFFAGLGSGKLITLAFNRLTCGRRKKSRSSDQK